MISMIEDDRTEFKFSWVDKYLRNVAALANPAVDGSTSVWTTTVTSWVSMTSSVC